MSSVHFSEMSALREDYVDIVLSLIDNTKTWTSYDFAICQ